MSDYAVRKYYFLGIPVWTIARSLTDKELSQKAQIIADAIMKEKGDLVDEIKNLVLSEINTALNDSHKQ